MGPKTIAILAVLTVCSVVAAAVALTLESAGSRDARIGKPVFPGLLERANDVASLTIESRRGTLTVERSVDGWRLRESDGFRVMTVKARGSVLDLASLKFFEEKTSRPDRYYKLYLRDITEPDSESKHVTVRDKDGNILADAIVGRGKSNLPGIEGGGTFLRLPGDKRTWLAQGGVNLGEIPSDWLDRQLFDIAGERIRRAQIVQPNGETLVITKRVPQSLVYSLNAIPPGMKVKYDEEPKLVATNLERFLIEDVRRAGAIPFPPDGIYRSSFETFDGLKALVELTIVDQRGWVRFNFAGTGKAAAEAQALNEKTGDWVFRIAQYRAERFIKSLDEMLVPADAKTN